MLLLTLGVIQAPPPVQDARQAVQRSLLALVYTPCAEEDREAFFTHRHFTALARELPDQPMNVTFSHHLITSYHSDYRDESEDRV